jgi:Cdc6-like AAA superfamily ATPase
MNFENIGSPIAIIKREGKSKNPPTLSVSSKNVDDEPNQPFDFFKLKGNDIFQLIPNPKTERQIIYITGASGSGKSFFTQLYGNEYKRVYPKRDVYLFSSLDDDSSIDKIKGIRRINIKTPEFLTDNITAEDFKESLVIFDDTDCLTNKPIKLKVNSILNSLLETGRHFNASVIFTSHLPCAGNDTKRILNESHIITFFPHSLGGRSLKYLLDNYLGLDKQQIKKVKGLESRWVSVIKSYPQVVISEKEVYTISHKDE